MLNYVFPYINGTEPEFPGGEGGTGSGGGGTGGNGGGGGGTLPGVGSMNDQFKSIFYDFFFS